MIDFLWWIFDIAMVALLWILGWSSCAVQSARRAITLFIALGLLLALVWARLNAPDLALAEAAIGAGIAGALLLAALRDDNTERQETKPGMLVAWAVNLLSILLFVIMGFALWQGITREHSP